MNIPENKNWSKFLTSNFKVNYEYHGMVIDYCVFHEEFKDLIIGFGFDIPDNHKVPEPEADGIVHHFLHWIVFNEFPEKLEIFRSFYYRREYIPGSQCEFEEPFYFLVDKEQFYYFKNGIRQIRDDYYNTEKNIDKILKLIQENISFNKLSENEIRKQILQKARLDISKKFWEALVYSDERRELAQDSNVLKPSSLDNLSEEEEQTIRIVLEKHGFQWYP